MKFTKYLMVGMILLLALSAFAPLTAPNAPTPQSPADGAKFTKLDGVVFDWNTVSNADTYELQVAKNSNFSTIVVNETTTDPASAYTTVSGDLTDYGISYFWRVRACDTTPSCSAWSDVRSIKMGVVSPAGLALDPVVPLTLRPKFTWTHAMNADGYVIEVAKESGFSAASLVPISTGGTPTQGTTDSGVYAFTPAISLPAEITLYWHVKAVNASLGDSAWSAAASFTSANPPSVPVLTYPADGGFASLTPTLKWNAVTLPGTTSFDHYEVRLYYPTTSTLVGSWTDADDSDLGLLATESFAPTYTFIEGNTYYWNLRAFNTNGEYSTSTAFDFKITTVGSIDDAKMNPSQTLGNVPGLKGPGVILVPVSGDYEYISSFTGTVRGNVNLLSLKPTFEWGNAPVNATTVRLQYARKNDNSCNVASPNGSTFAVKTDVTLPSTTYEYTVSLLPGEVYCWRVRGEAGAALGPWSTVQIFKTANPPTVPKPDGTLPKLSDIDAGAYPSGFFTNDVGPKLNWTKSDINPGTEFGKYEVEIAYYIKGTAAFSGYSYPDGTVAPYTGTITYPLPAPIFYDGTTKVNDPVQAIIKQYDEFPNFPMVDQAHDPTTDLPFNYDDPIYLTKHFYEVEEVVDSSPLGYPLYGDFIYYWRVRAFNKAGHYSAWSEPRLIGITADRPTNLSVSDCQANAAKPCINWDTVKRAKKYNVVILTKAAQDPFGEINVPYRIEYGDVETNVGVYKLKSALDANKKYYYYVRTVGKIYAQYSQPAGDSFTSYNPPTAPVAVLPVNNLLVGSTTPTLKWGASTLDGNEPFGKYVVEVYDGDGTTLIYSASTTPGDIYKVNYKVPAGNLQPAHIYFWRVRACNAVPECSAWTALSKFRVSVAVPTLTAPATGSTAASLKPKLTWNTVIPNGGYTLQLGTASNFSGAFSAEVGSATYTPANNLKSGTTYFWRVRTRSSAYGPGPWSSPFKFTTPTIGKPVLTAPVGGITVTSLKPTFKWNVVPFANRYYIKISKNSNCQEPLINTTVTTNSFIPINNLPKATTWYWCVQAEGTGFGKGPWSSIANFKTP